MSEMTRIKTKVVVSTACEYCHRRIVQCSSCSNTFLENDAVYCIYKYGEYGYEHLCDNCKIGE